MGNQNSSTANTNTTAADEQDPEEFDDPVEKLLKKTGCLEKHYAVQECIAETKDWRKCQEVVKTFRACIEEHQKNKDKAI